MRPEIRLEDSCSALDSLLLSLRAMEREEFSTFTSPLKASWKHVLGGVDLLASNNAFEMSLRRLLGKNMYCCVRDVDFGL